MFHVKHFLFTNKSICAMIEKGGDIMANEVITLINSLGLPTMVACASMWYVKYREDKNDARMDKLNESHKQEMADITEAVNNNTLALQRICDTFEQKKEE
jgi:hypothetical protein